MSTSVFGLVVALVVCWAWRSQQTQETLDSDPATRSFTTTAAVLFVFAIFGGLVGYAGGNSRVGVVGDLIPAVVSFIAGLAAYFFGTKRSEARPLLFPMVTAMIVTLFLSYGLGAGNRAGNQDSASTILKRETCAEAFTNADILSDDVAFQRLVTLMGKTCRHLMNTKAFSDLVVKQPLDGSPDRP